MPSASVRLCPRLAAPVVSPVVSRGETPGRPSDGSCWRPEGRAVRGSPAGGTALRARGLSRILQAICVGAAGPARSWAARISGAVAGLSLERASRRSSARLKGPRQQPGRRAGAGRAAAGQCPLRQPARLLLPRSCSRTARSGHVLGPWGGPICSAVSSAGLPSSRKMRSCWRESSGGLRG